MKNYAHAVLSLTALLTTGARADCLVAGQAQHPGDRLVQRSVTMTGTTVRCPIIIHPCGRCRLLSGHAASAPRVGALRQDGLIFFITMPRAGSDRFSIRWCEDKPENHNECYLAAYTVTRQ